MALECVLIPLWLWWESTVHVKICRCSANILYSTLYILLEQFTHAVRELQCRDYTCWVMTSSSDCFMWWKCFIIYLWMHHSGCSHIMLFGGDTCSWQVARKPPRLCVTTPDHNKPSLHPWWGGFTASGSGCSSYQGGRMEFFFFFRWTHTLEKLL